MHTATDLVNFKGVESLYAQTEKKWQKESPCSVNLQFPVAWNCLQASGERHKLKGPNAVASRWISKRNLFWHEGSVFCSWPSELHRHIPKKKKHTKGKACARSGSHDTDVLQTFQMPNWLLALRRHCARSFTASASLFAFVEMSLHIFFPFFHLKGVLIWDTRGHNYCSACCEHRTQR